MVRPLDGDVGGIWRCNIVTILHAHGAFRFTILWIRQRLLILQVYEAEE